MKRSENIASLAVALCKFQAKVKNPSNNATNPLYKSKYSTLDNVINTVRPVLAEFGLSYIQTPHTSDDGLHMGVTTLLMHESGEWIESDPVVLPAYKQGKGGEKIYDAQAAGIAITYARRYSLSSMLGISSEDDDDANGIVHESETKKPATSKQIGLLKTRVLALADKRKVTDTEVYKHLGVTDITKLSSSEASALIKKVEGWLSNAEKGA